MRIDGSNEPSSAALKPQVGAALRHLKVYFERVAARTCYWRRKVRASLSPDLSFRWQIPAPLCFLMARLDESFRTMTLARRRLQQT